MIIEVDAKEIEKQMKKMKRKERWRKIKTKMCTAANWIVENKEVAAGVTAGLTAVATVGKKLSRRKRLKEEKDLKELYIYDRSLGHYWKTRRPLTTEEWVCVDRRRRNGEKIGDILLDLRVL